MPEGFSTTNKRTVPSSSVSRRRRRSAPEIGFQPRGARSAEASSWRDQSVCVSPIDASWLLGSKRTRRSVTKSVPPRATPRRDQFARCSRISASPSGRSWRGQSRPRCRCCRKPTADACTAGPTREPVRECPRPQVGASRTLHRKTSGHRDRTATHPSGARHALAGSRKTCPQNCPANGVATGCARVSMASQN